MSNKNKLSTAASKKGAAVDNTKQDSDQLNAQAQADAQAQAEAEAKAKADAEAKAQADAEAKAKADAVAVKPKDSVKIGKGKQLPEFLKFTHPDGRVLQFKIASKGLFTIQGRTYTPETLCKEGNEQALLDFANNHPRYFTEVFE